MEGVFTDASHHLSCFCLYEKKTNGTWVWICIMLSYSGENYAARTGCLTSSGTRVGRQR